MKTLNLLILVRIENLLKTKKFCIWIIIIHPFLIAKNPHRCRIVEFPNYILLDLYKFSLSNQILVQIAYSYPFSVLLSSLIGLQVSFQISHLKFIYVLGNSRHLVVRQACTESHHIQMNTLLEELQSRKKGIGFFTEC